MFFRFGLIAFIVIMKTIIYMKTIPKFRLFTIFCLSFLVGIGISPFLEIDFQKSYFIIIFAVLALLLAATINYLLRNILLTLLSISSAMVFTGLFYYAHFEFRNTPKIDFGVEKKISGEIVQKPDVDYSKQKVIIETEEGRILVTLPHYPAVNYGDKIQFSGKIIKPQKIDEFDYAKYLKKDLVFGIVTSPKEIVAESSRLSSTQKIFKTLYAIGDSLEQSINRVLPEPSASLAAGLVLGLKRNISDQFKDDLATTGLTHIIALSGYNITIIITVLTNLLLTFTSRKRVLVIGTVIIIAFVILTGASSSVVRAAIFSLLVMMGKTVGRQADFTNLMLLAALIMILFNPFVLSSDVGFQLSFLAFSGLIYLSPIIEKLIDQSRARLLPEFIKNPLRETLSAQVAVLPLVLTIFGRVSLIAPIANILVLWALPWAMGLSFLAGLLGLIFYPFGKFSALFAWPILEYLIKVVEVMARVPLAAFAVKTGIFSLEAALFVVLIGAIILFSRKFKIIY